MSAQRDVADKLEKLWEAHSETVTTIECDMVSDEVVMSRRDFDKAGARLAEIILAELAGEQSELVEALRGLTRYDHECTIDDPAGMVEWADGEFVRIDDIEAAIRAAERKG